MTDSFEPKTTPTSQYLKAAASVDWRTKGAVTAVKDQGKPVKVVKVVMIGVLDEQELRPNKFPSQANVDLATSSLLLVL